jgi:hypothetical protein
MRYRPLLLLYILAAGAASAGPPPHRPLTEQTIRAFLARQERLWIHRNFPGFFALAAPEAIFATVRSAPDGSVTSERETVAESRRSAEKVFGTIDRFAETSTIDSIEIAPDGVSARVLGHEQAEVFRGPQRKRLCAATEQKLILRNGQILSLGQIDRMEPCPSE